MLLIAVTINEVGGYWMTSIFAFFNLTISRTIYIYIYIHNLHILFQLSYNATFCAFPCHVSVKMC